MRFAISGGVFLLWASAILSAAVSDAAPATTSAPAVAMAPPAAGLPAYPAVVRNDSPEAQAARLKWFREARFGMFIHWGVYAVPGGFWHGKPVTAEWIMNRAKIPVAEYRALAKQFTASKYDPAAWASLAQEAGMKYVVITAKHHEGFALFDSAVSDWNAVQASGAGRDLVQPLADAVRAKGLKFGCYYSQAQDWVNPGGSKGTATPWDDAQKGSFDDYLKNVSLPQVKEIVAKFHPDILWWDTEYQMTPERARPFFDFVVSQPDLIFNSRLGGGVLGDFRTSEQKIPTASLGGRALEVNMTINNSWGFRSDDLNWKSSQQLIHNLSDVASLGGNYLLNVGPTAEGEIPAPEVERLRAIGAWMKVNGEAIYGTSGSPFAKAPSWGRVTQKSTGDGATLYLHIWHWPADGKLLVANVNDAPLSAKLLATGDSVSTEKSSDGLTLTLPATAPDPDVTVVALQLARPLENDANKSGR